jgi:hypothetical protein
VPAVLVVVSLVSLDDPDSEDVAPGIVELAAPVSTVSSGDPVSPPVTPLSASSVGVWFEVVCDAVVTSEAAVTFDDPAPDVRRDVAS